MTRGFVINEEFFLKRVKINSSGCWIWTAGLAAHGYAVVPHVNAHRLYGTHVGHRVSYAALVGPIPKGLEIDHLCHVRACVNPDHLEAVTHQENDTRRNERFLRENPTFPCGHSRVGDHVAIKRDGYYKNGKPKLKPVCRPCMLSTQVQYNKKRDRRNYATSNRIRQTI